MTMAATLKVLDLSHHNSGPHGGDIDFVKIAAAGIKGIIHKSSQGVANFDRTYSHRRALATAAGLHWGAYHFADSSDPAMQVDQFLRAALPDDNTLMALDYEPNGSSTMTLLNARAFLLALEEKIGRKGVLYSGNLIKETLGNRPDEVLGAHRLWLAHYNDNPKWPAAWESPWLHQFSGDGVNNHGIVIPGVDPSQASQLDMNSYARDDESLAQEWAA